MLGKQAFGRNANARHLIKRCRVNPRYTRRESAEIERVVFVYIIVLGDPDAATCHYWYINKFVPAPWSDIKPDAVLAQSEQAGAPHRQLNLLNMCRLGTNL